MLALARMPKWMEILEEETYEMKMHRFVRVCMMVAVVAILFGLYTSSSYGQETSTTDDTIAPANPPSTPNYVNAAKGYEIGGDIVLSHAGRVQGNIGLGIDALAHNAVGMANTAIGYKALQANTFAAKTRPPVSMRSTPTPRPPTQPPVTLRSETARETITPPSVLMPAAIS
jgi:hypothetical protein